MANDNVCLCNCRESMDKPTNDSCAAASADCNIENENTVENELISPISGGVPSIVFTNEKGNVRAGVRKELRDGILVDLNKIFAAHPYKKVKNVNGGFSLLLGNDSNTNDKIWAHIELTVNMKSPNADSFSGVIRPRVSDEIPDLFGK